MVTWPWTKIGSEALSNGTIFHATPCVYFTAEAETHMTYLCQKPRIEVAALHNSAYVYSINIRSPTSHAIVYIKVSGLLFALQFVKTQRKDAQSTGNTDRRHLFRKLSHTVVRGPAYSAHASWPMDPSAHKQSYSKSTSYMIYRLITVAPAITLSDNTTVHFISEQQTCFH